MCYLLKLFRSGCTCLHTYWIIVESHYEVEILRSTKIVNYLLNKIALHQNPQFNQLKRFTKMNSVYFKVKEMVILSRRPEHKQTVSCCFCGFVFKYRSTATPNLTYQRVQIVRYMRGPTSFWKRGLTSSLVISGRALGVGSRRYSFAVMGVEAGVQFDRFQVWRRLIQYDFWDSQSLRRERSQVIQFPK